MFSQFNLKNSDYFFFLVILPCFNFSPDTSSMFSQLNLARTHVDVFCDLTVLVFILLPCLVNLVLISDIVKIPCLVNLNLVNPSLS